MHIIVIVRADGPADAEVYEKPFRQLFGVMGDPEPRPRGRRLMARDAVLEIGKDPGQTGPGYWGELRCLPTSMERASLWVQKVRGIAPSSPVYGYGARGRARNRRGVARG